MYPSVVSQEYFTILAKIQIDLDLTLHHSSCQTGMFFSERRYADDLPTGYTVTRYLG
jgi:hypothetical protein